MKASISWARVVGLPSYSSARASVDLQCDLDGAPEVIVSELRRLFALAQSEVDHQLAEVEPRPDQAEPPARDRLPSQARPPSAPEPTRQYDPRIGPDGAARFKTDGFPRSGRELVPWSRKREESGAYPGLFKRLVAYGKSQGFREMVNTWNADEVKEAVYGVLGDGFDEPEPEPAHNGHNGNGNGYFNGHGNGRGAY